MLNNLSKLIEDIDIIQIDGNLDKEVSLLTIDSRKVIKDSLYFAIKGFTLDGHKFIKNSIERGATTIIYEDSQFNFSKEFKDVTFIMVKDIRKVEAILAHKFYDNPTTKMKIIGITGTNGKTSTTHILDSILNTATIKSGVIGTIGYKIGDKLTTLANTTPDAIELVSIFDKMQKEGVEVVIMEVSSHALSLFRVWKIEFDIVLWSNLTQDHLDFHKDMEDYYQAKKLLFTNYLDNSIKSDKKIIINIDDSYGRRLIQELRELDGNYTLYTTSIKEKADFKIKEYRLFLSGMLFAFKNENKEFMIQSSLVGEYNIYNILSAISAAKTLDISIETISLALNKMKQIPGRLENCNIEDRNIFVDYAHTPDAVESVLRTLKPLVGGKLYAILGAGGDRDRTKRPLMSLAAVKYCDMLILTSDNPRSEDPNMILDDLERPIKDKENYLREVDRKVAIESTLLLLTPDDALVICGKGHEDYQIIGDKKYHFSDMEVVKAYYANDIKN